MGGDYVATKRTRCRRNRRVSLCASTEQNASDHADEAAGLLGDVLTSETSAWGAIADSDPECGPNPLQGAT